VGAAALLMPVCWNLILRWTGATDAPRPALPTVPGQLAGHRSRRVHPRRSATALSLGVCTKDPARRTGLLALWAALGAFLIDIYTY